MDWHRNQAFTFYMDGWKQPIASSLELENGYYDGGASSFVPRYRHAGCPLAGAAVASSPVP